MKKIITSIMLLGATLMMAQTNVYLNINHMLGNQVFSSQTSATNNYSNPFNVSRLEYYIAEITLIHDGGTKTPVTDKYMLVNAKDSTSEMLGSFNITSLEGIQFGIGVDANKNHSDPASYPSNHPLAPKSPSMHWGWTAGYRFVAMEGKSGSNLNFTYELHALDDANYFIQTVPTSGTLNGSDLHISLTADYEKALENIDISSGIVVHGSTAEAKDLLMNFNWNVFKSSEGNASISINENHLAENITVYPNPANSQHTLSVTGLDNMDVTLSSVAGKTLFTTSANSSVEYHLSSLSSGLYFVFVKKDNEVIKVEKLVITD